MPEPFEVAIPDETLEDLRGRLEHVKLPHRLRQRRLALRHQRRLPARARRLLARRYDWRAQERAMNALRHFRHEIDGVPIHFVHERGKGRNPCRWSYARLALDLLGLPKVIGPLTDPGGARRRSGRRLRRRRAVAPGLRLLDAAHDDRRERWSTADLWAEADDATSSATTASARGRRLGRAVTGPARPQVCRPARRRPPEPGRRQLDLFTAGCRVDDYAPEEMHALRRAQSRLRAATSHVCVQARAPDPRLRAARFPGSGCCLARRAAAGLERLRRRRRAPLHQGRAAHHVMLYWATESLRDLGALLRGGRTPVDAVARPDAGRRGPDGARDLPGDNCLPPDALCGAYYNVKRSRTCRRAAISRRWRSRTSSSTTSASSSFRRGVM